MALPDDDPTSIRVSRGLAFCAWAMLAGLLLVLPAILSDRRPGPDSSTYYLPMARALARGDFQAAFFHMIPPLFPVLVGMVAGLGVNNTLTAGKLVSALCTVGSVPGVYELVRRLASERIARWAVVLFLISPRVLRYAGNAGPDTLKMLLLIYLALALIWYLSSGRLAAGAMAGALTGLATLARSECAVFGALLVIMPTARWWWQREPATGRRRPCWREAFAAALAVAAMLAVVAPWVLHQRRQTGYWVTDSRQLALLQRVGLASAEAVRQHTVPPRPADAVRRMPRKAGDHWANANAAPRGLDRLYLVVAVAGLLLGHHRRYPFRLEHALLLGIVGLNLIVFLLTGYINKRYVAITQPFLLPWVAFGLLAIYAWLVRLPWRWVRPCLWALGVMMGLLFLRDRLLADRPSSDPEKRELVEFQDTFAAWVAAHRQEFAHRPPPVSTRDTYHNGLRPVVLAAEESWVFAAEAGLVTLDNRYRFSTDLLLERCRQAEVDLVLVTPELHACVTGLEQLLDEASVLTLAADWQVAGQRIGVYRLQP
jgi:4-amino-4-deoxy-L-arabinose transferase-like glycosyltransferase